MVLDAFLFGFYATLGALMAIGLTALLVFWLADKVKP